MHDWYTDCLERCWCCAIPGCSIVSQLRRLSINSLCSIIDVWLRLGSIKFSDPLFHDIVSITQMEYRYQKMKLKNVGTSA